MRCPNCHFENIEGEERCFRCHGFLGQVPAENLMPPRRKEAPAASRLYNILSDFRKFSYRLRLNEAVEFGRPVFFLIPPLASLIIPGLGQVLNRRYGKALLFFSAYLVLLAWFYLGIFRGGYLPGLMLPLFFLCLGSSPYLLVMVHTWIAFDAYLDAVRSREHRRIGVWESVAVSLLISAFVVFFLTLPRRMAEERLTMYRMVNVPILAPFYVLDGDILILDQTYYDRRPVAFGQIVENCGLKGMQTGGEMVLGRIPGVVLGLPGDKIRFHGGGIFRASRRLARLPAPWRTAVADCEFTVPEERYFLLPANIYGDFPGTDNLCVGKKDLGGKYIFLFFPESHRRILP